MPKRPRGSSPTLGFARAGGPPSRALRRLAIARTRRRSFPTEIHQKPPSPRLAAAAAPRPDALILHAWSELATGPRAALDTCRLAAETAHPADPTPWVAMLAALRLLGRPGGELTSVWREINARDAWHREAHLQVLGYLSPEEQGSQSSLRDFLDDVRAAMPSGAPAACLPLAAAVRQYHRDLDSGGTRVLGASRYWAQPHVAPLLDHALEHWLRPGFRRHAAALADLNLLAYALARAGRAGQATPVTHATGGLVTAWPWGHDGDPVDRYTYWYGRISG
ncbi:hypothetical protein [Streptomyces sp. NBC_00878]|uniref:hypothetical protein n=1 Tax=Streptomyces sp. NBC_00878 TaxID=2975854 RepID=UPI0022596022|nr:hypothetical protein [Streptomyces sp. NBC_00878]MCX4906321.1 hypothetical protein [Streptomyces sp. NBC_00878]